MVMRDAEQKIEEPSEDDEEDMPHTNRKTKSRKRIVEESDDAEDLDAHEPPTKKQRSKHGNGVHIKSDEEKPLESSKKHIPDIASNSRAALKVSQKIKGKKDTHDEKPKVATNKNKSKVAEQVINDAAADDDAAPATSVKSPDDEGAETESNNEQDDTGSDSEIDEKPEIAAKAREKVQSTLKMTGKDPYPDWKPGEPVPYAALCTTFSKIEMTTKRLEILAHCSLFLRQVLRLSPNDLLPTVLLMINKLAADYSGIELGIGESLIMKAIGESTGRSLGDIKADQHKIGDLGLVAAKSRSNQPTMFKPKPLTVRGVWKGLMEIATVEGQGAQGRKVGGIKKLLSAADASSAGKGKGVDITKDKGGPSEAKYIVRTLEGKLRLGLAEKTVIVALAQAVVFNEVSKEGEKVPSTDQLERGEKILKSVYRFVSYFEYFDRYR